MRIGLAGVGRIGRSTPRPCATSPTSTRWSSPTLDADAARRRRALEVGYAPRRPRCSPRRRRLRHRDRDPRPRPAAAARHRGRRRDVLREAGRRHARGDDGPRRTRRDGATVPVHVGFQRRFDRGYQRPGRPWSAGSASSTASGGRTTRRPRTRPTSRPAVASSATARSTTSTSSGSSPAARSSRSTRRAPTRATPSSPRPATSTPPRPCSPSTTARSSRSATRYNGAGHDVRMEVLGSRARSAVGYDDSLALRSAEPGVTTPPARGTGRSWSASCRPTAPS